MGPDREVRGVSGQYNPDPPHDGGSGSQWLGKLTLIGREVEVVTPDLDLSTFELKNAHTGKVDGLVSCRIIAVGMLEEYTPFLQSPPGQRFRGPDCRKEKGIRRITDPP